VNDVKVICSLCDHEQNVQQVCENYGVCMGEYLCSTCKLFDDEVSLFYSPFATNAQMVMSSLNSYHWQMWVSGQLIRYFLNSTFIGRFNFINIKKFWFHIFLFPMWIHGSLLKDTHQSF
jgi:hypothetical protein